MIRVQVPIRTHGQRTSSYNIRQVRVRFVTNVTVTGRPRLVRVCVTGRYYPQVTHCDHNRQPRVSFVTFVTVAPGPLLPRRNVTQLSRDCH